MIKLTHQPPRAVVIPAAKLRTGDTFKMPNCDDVFLRTDEGGSPGSPYIRSVSLGSGLTHCITNPAVEVIPVLVEARVTVECAHGSSDEKVSAIQRDLEKALRAPRGERVDNQ